MSQLHTSIFDNKFCSEQRKSCAFSLSTVVIYVRNKIQCSSVSGPQLSEEVGYVLYSALGSFYIPSCIMVFVYIRIYFAAKARARRGIRKPPRRPPQDAVTTFTTAPGITKSMEQPAGSGSIDRNSNQSPRETDQQIATIEAHPQPISIPTVTCDFASDISTCSDAAEMQQEANEEKDTLKVWYRTTSMDDALARIYEHVFATGQAVRNQLSQCQFRGSTLSVNGELQQQAAAMARIRQPSVGIDTDMPIFGKKTNSKSRRSDETRATATSGNGSGGSDRHEQPVVPRVQKPRDPEREKRRIARKKEKRATLILGLIMGSFIACWLPFFFMYILRLAYDIPEIAFSTAFWLGYMNSALNPVIYTIFNKDFRRAFRRILFK
ncbi:alpha2-adrenergic-like octopamine receptor [Carabus blaptoides fortunei]